MTARDLLCACEDVTVQDAHEAIAAGHTDMESLKRFTGLATGICQGRACLARAAGLLCARGAPAATLAPTTQRPPLTATRLGLLACDGPLPAMFPGPEAPARTAGPVLPVPPGNLPPLPDSASIVIIGGGILGLATAYQLARLGQRGVVVLERGYLNAGASGRNGGGVRASFATELNVRLMHEAMRLCRAFAHELGINIWLRQGGYLFLARDEATRTTFETMAALHRRLGMRTRMLTPAGCAKVVPSLAVADVQAGCFNPDDGVIFPWPFLWGYAEHAQRLGVHVATFTQATGLELRNGLIEAVHTSRGRIRADLVINAAAAWSGEVAALAGVCLQNRPERHEIMVTESLRPFLHPLVSEFDSGLYFSQSMRGEIVAGMGEATQPPGVEMRGSLRFIMRVARGLCRRLPALGNVQLVRQWAGCYDVTPDGNPMLGAAHGPSNFFQANGFMGHGFMMAPAIGRRIAAHLTRGQTDEIFTAFSPQRFARGQEIARETLIIG